MKDYSRPKANAGKTTFRTGDKWRIRKTKVVRDIKAMNRWKTRLPQTKSQRKSS